MLAPQPLDDSSSLWLLLSVTLLGVEDDAEELAELDGADEVVESEGGVVLEGFSTKEPFDSTSSSNITSPNAVGVSQ